MLKEVLIFAVISLIQVQAKNVALVIGGYGGQNTIEVITDKKVCAPFLTICQICQG